MTFSDCLSLKILILIAKKKKKENITWIQFKQLPHCLLGFYKVHSAGVSWCRQKPEFLPLFRAKPVKRIIQENKQLHSPHRHFLTSLGRRREHWEKQSCL